MSSVIGMSKTARPNSGVSSSFPRKPQKSVITTASATDATTRPSTAIGRGVKDTTSNSLINQTHYNNDAQDKQQVKETIN